MENLALSLINQYGLIGVFLSTVIAYSILPFPSEAALIAASFVFKPTIIIIVALLGSTVGSLTNYYIGHKGIRKYINKESNGYKKAKNLFKKYGPLSLIFFVSLPIIGDPLVIFAGSMNLDFKKFLVYSTIGKLIYFILILSVGEGLEQLILG